MGSKLFRDAVHGYIRIPEGYCKDFVDTPEFQRLRYVEQTSMRILFPSARHDRFVHSLGTFHLGSQCCDVLESESKEVIGALKESGKWEGLRRTFEIACLLHDVGHAPFSHALEYAFEATDYPISTLLTDLASQHRAEKWDSSLNKDVDREERAKEHEIASACLVLSRFAEEIEKYGANPALAARMIMGYTYEDAQGKLFERMANVFIDLLNGEGTIDVDKLDYTVRDSWASGVSNVVPDIQRLISSLRVCQNPDKSLQLAFHKSGLSAVQQVFDARSHLFRWVFSHHKVVYGTELVQDAFDGMTKCPRNDLLARMNLKEFCHTNGKSPFLLPSDNEVFAMLRDFSREDLPGAEAAKEWFSRKHTRKPLWKSYAEYRQNKMIKKILARIRGMDATRHKVDVKIKQKLNDLKARDEWHEQLSSGSCKIIYADASARPMDPKSVYVDVGDGSPPVPYDNVFEGQAGACFDAPFFYIFVPITAKEERRKLLNDLTELVEKIF